jgi:hypothetical protein
MSAKQMGDPRDRCGCDAAKGRDGSAIDAAGHELHRFPVERHIWLAARCSTQV